VTDTYSASPHRTVAALYDTLEKAEAAVGALVAGGFERGSIDVTANTETGAVGRPVQEHGFWHSITSMFDSDDDDAHVYGEGIRRGGTLVTVHTTEQEVDDAIEILDAHDPTNVEDSARGWQAEGWSKPAAATAPLTTGVQGEEVIPVVEEQLVVGKREVDRGNVRVRSFVREVPVSAQVSLRHEDVHVERRAVDRPLTDADTAFRDRTIEMTEVNEEAVVGKTARVTEEVVVGKGVSERTETVSDTVRKTEVEIEDGRSVHSDTPTPR
jgi:uncharacterized protein (TIGR02271 family)